MPSITDYITGSAFRGDGDAKADAALQAASDRFNIPLPDLQKMAAENENWLEDLQASTVDSKLGYDPVEAERSALVTAGPSAMEDITTDPRLKDQQLASLAALKDLADNGGMNAQDVANLERVKSEVGQADRGRRDAIMQNAAARGMGGGGMELLAQLSSSQAATDRNAQQGLDISGMAQARALDAMMKGGALAGDVRGQDFGEQSAVAQAKDAITKFNASNATSNNQFNAGQGNSMTQFNAGNTMDANKYNIDTEKFNAGQTQDANKYNIGGKQQVESNNTGTANNVNAYNAQLPQNQFDNKTALASGKAGVDTTKAGVYTNKADKDQEGWQSFIGGASTVAGGAATKSDERSKKDIKDVDSLDLDAFLASISPKKFKYKDSKDGEGDRTGVMAQDLLKSKLGAEAVVVDENSTLGYDKDKMQGVIIAALKHLSNKIDDKEG